MERNSEEKTLQTLIQEESDLSIITEDTVLAWEVVA
jgi:hypothetical protein